MLFPEYQQMQNKPKEAKKLIFAQKCNYNPLAQSHLIPSYPFIQTTNQEGHSAKRQSFNITHKIRNWKNV